MVEQLYTEELLRAAFVHWDRRAHGRREPVYTYGRFWDICSQALSLQ